LLRRYLSHYPGHLNIKWEQFMQLGKLTENPAELFSMSVLAARLSQEMNAVSRIHCRVTRDMFRSLYPGYYPAELPIGYVTNGVHLPTWASKSWQDLYTKFSRDFMDNQSDQSLWEKIREVDDEIIWKIRTKQKRALTDYLMLRLYGEMTRRNEDPKMIFRLREATRKQAMTFGFARRFATYKRAHLLFTNLPRLAKIVNSTKKPVRFIFAGKAHPKDKAGQDLIRKIYEISKTPEFMGKIIFVENYDIELAQYLIQGVDVWLNMPTRPLEASGTSGEKAVMNGVVNFSVLDGWWAEGYRQDAGWALREETTYDNPQSQDELDAETIYTLLEEEIIPMYYDCNEKKIPVKWIGYIRNTIAGIAPHFTMKRQLDDYHERFYKKLAHRSKAMNLHSYELARHIASWKRNVLKGWNSIQVVSMEVPDSTQKPMILGDTFKAEVVLDLKELRGTEVGVEVVFGKKVNDEVNEPILIEEMKLSRTNKSTVTYACEIPFNQAGVYDFSFRIFPKNELLPHRQDLSLVKWI
ncbi:MAG TPA: alpha-glucan family phosphorylase, partial [Bacteroidales bacterium]|nr:alpha-glucan family phosphorylase [Bacteroidales bacterium]